jgi:sugar/nucleoside kinase (ribokinase family)
MKVLCVGDCGVDLYLPAGERRAGGICLNFALAARECFSAKDVIEIVAPLGNDDGAALVRERLADSGIEADFRILDGKTPVQEIQLDENGERHFIAYHEGVLADFRADYTLSAALCEAELVVTPVFAQNRDMFLSVINAEYLAFTAVDFADFAEDPDFALLDAVVDRVDVGFFGLRAEQTDIIARLRTLAADRDATFIVTLGAAGCQAFRCDKSFEHAAADAAEIIDTTGAGDAFAAGFLSRYCRTQDMQLSLARGTQMAAVAVARWGGN